MSPLKKGTKKSKISSFFSRFSKKTSTLEEKIEEQSEKFKELWQKFQKEQLPSILKQEQFKERSEKFKEAWKVFQKEHLPKIAYLVFKHSPTLFTTLLTKNYLLLPIHLYQLLQDIGKQYNVSFPFIEEKPFNEFEDYKQLDIIIKMTETLLKAKEIKKVLKKRI